MCTQFLYLLKMVIKGGYPFSLGSFYGWGHVEATWSTFLSSHAPCKLRWPGESSWSLAGPETKYTSTLVYLSEVAAGVYLRPIPSHQLPYTPTQIDRLD